MFLPVARLVQMDESRKREQEYFQRGKKKKKKKTCRKKEVPLKDGKTQFREDWLGLPPE